MSGTDILIAYPATYQSFLYAMSGTDLAYAPTRGHSHDRRPGQLSAYALAMRCPVGAERCDDAIAITGTPYAMSGTGMENTAKHY
eukprot:3940877-Rhodomonas_salina.3